MILCERREFDGMFDTCKDCDHLAIIHGLYTDDYGIICTECAIIFLDPDFEGNPHDFE